MGGHFFHPFPELITNRLSLRQLEPADAQEIFLLRSDAEISRYIDRPVANSITDGLKFIHKINISISQDESIYWAIVPKGAESLIGTICLWNWNRQNKTAELGYELFPSAQGKGFMHEALTRVIPFGFDVMGLNTIQAWIHPANLRSIRLIEKNGFTADTSIDSVDKEGTQLYLLKKPH